MLEQVSLVPKMAEILQKDWMDVVAAFAEHWKILVVTVVVVAAVD